MPVTRTMKRNDTARTLTDQLLFAGSPIDLTEATQVKLLMRKLDGTLVINRLAAITNATEGRVNYTFQASEISNQGVFLIEWEITFSDLRILTVPDDGYHRLQILADLG